MPLFSRRSFCTVVFAAALLFGVQAHAQSSQDMDLLSQQEHQAFAKRLQRSTSSAERARITAEMNRIVQERRLQLRQQHGAQGEKSANGQGKAK